MSLLATHPEVQDRVRQEILNALENNEGQDLSYDELVSLPLLDAVCRETLRLCVRSLCLAYLILLTPATNTQQLSTSLDSTPNVRGHDSSSFHWH